MSETFDPYYTWLGIPPHQQPPNHYRLLSLQAFEDHPEVIANAADRQMLHVRTFQHGKHAAASQKLLNELSAAQACLLNAGSKAAYDAKLRQDLSRVHEPQLAAFAPPPEASPERSLPGPAPSPRTAGFGESPLTSPPAAAEPAFSPRVPLESPPPPPAIGGAARPPIPPPKATPPSAAVPRARAPAAVPAAPPAAGGNGNGFFSPPAASIAAPPTSDEADALEGLSPRRTPRHSSRSALVPLLLLLGSGAGLLVILGLIAVIAAIGAMRSSPAPRDVAGSRPQPKTVTKVVSPRENAPDDGDEIAPPPPPEFDEHLVPPAEIPAESGTDGGGPPPPDSPPADEATPGSPAEPPKPLPPPDPLLAEGKARPPVPADAALGEARFEFNGAFGRLVQKAKTPEEKLQVARDLLLAAAGDTYRDRAEMRYVILDQAFQSAVEAGDRKQAEAIVDLLDDEFAIDSLQRRKEMLLGVIENAPAPENRYDVLIVADQMILELAAARRFDEAEEFRNRAFREAKTHVLWYANGGALVKNLQQIRRDLNDREDAWKKIEAAGQTLKTSPADPPASTLYGRYLCGVQSDWEAGLPLLAQSDDAQLKEAAELDLALPREPEAQVEVAHRWYDLADELHPGFFARARAWYWRAQDEVEELGGVNVKNRLQEIGDMGLERRYFVGARLPAAMDEARPAVAVESAAPPAAPGRHVEVHVELRDSLAGLEAPLAGLDLSPDAAILAGADDGGEVRLWRVEGLEEWIKIRPFRGGKAAAVAYSPKGDLFAAAGTDGGRCKINLSSAPSSLTAAEIDGTAGWIGAPVFSPDGKTLAAATGDNRVRLFDLKGVETAAAQAHGAVVRCLAFSPDGSWLASAAADQQVIAHRVTGASSRELTFEGHTGEVASVAWSPSGDLLASAGDDRLVIVWDVAGETEQTRIEAPAAIAAVAFCTEDLLVTAAGDGKLRFYDTHDWQERAVLDAHPSGIRAMAVAADGRLIATAAGDETLKLFSVSLTVTGG